MHKQGRVTLEDVARLAGVSRATASRVVRGDGTVTGKKVRAVQAAVSQLGYVPSSAARALAAGRSGIVAVIIPEPDRMVFSDPFFADTVQTVSAIVAEIDTQVVVTFADPAEHAGVQGGRTAAFLASGAVDGAIVVSHHQFNGQVEAYAAAPVPVVFIGRPVGVEERVAWVDSDNLGGGEMVARHFLDRGCRRPALVTGPMDMVASQDRLRGFRQAFLDAGVEPAVLNGDFTTEAGRAAAQALTPRIRSGEIDAVFLSNDLMAQAALTAWRADGLACPGDVLVAGYDDIDGSEELGLTSVVNSARVLSRAATRLLLQRLHGQEAEGPIILPAELVERSTTLGQANETAPSPDRTDTHTR